MLVKLTPVEFDYKLAISSGPRSEGLHASTIYGDLFQDLEPKRFKRDSEPPDLKMAMGLAWESHLERVFKHHGILAVRPDEQMSDEGIAFSPDLLVVNGTDRIGEIKLTYMSSRTGLDDPKFDKWLVQVMLYCWWCGLVGARFYILHVCGDYGKNRDPVFKVVDVDFTKNELRENYEMCVNHARSKGFLPKLTKERKR